jgi:hypothetical protein
MELLIRHMNPTSAAPLDPITELLATYTDLNSLQIEELAEVPSALESCDMSPIDRLLCEAVRRSGRRRGRGMCQL